MNKDRRGDWCDDDTCPVFIPGADHTSGCTSLCKYPKKEKKKDE